MPRPTPSDRLVCPTCGNRITVTQSPTPPFCSVRCQQIDLGRWLDEEIRVPYEGEHGDSEVEYRDEPRERRDVDDWDAGEED